MEQLALDPAAAPQVYSAGERLHLALGLALALWRAHPLPMLAGALALLVLTLAGSAGVYRKAGQPGWMALVPIGNILGLLKMVGASPLWVLVYFVPGLNLILHVVVNVLVARSFGRGVLFGLGLSFLPALFHPLLGFGGARYVGPLDTADRSLRRTIWGVGISGGVGFAVLASIALRIPHVRNAPFRLGEELVRYSALGCGVIFLLTRPLGRPAAAPRRPGGPLVRLVRGRAPRPRHQERLPHRHQRALHRRASASARARSAR